MTEITDRLKLETPAAGSFGWHVEWGRNMDTLDKHPGILVCTSTTRPETPWQGQAIFETDTENMFVFDGTAWRQVRLIKDCGYISPGTLETMFRIPGRYYGPHAVRGESTYVTISSNTLIFIPFVVTRPERFDRIGISIVSGSPGFFRLAMYDSDENFFPRNRLILTSKADTDTARNVEWEMSLDLVPGLYWLSYISDCSPSVLTYSNAYAYRLFGSYSISGVTTNRCHLFTDIDNIPTVVDPSSLSFGYGFPEIRLRKAST